MPRSNGSAIRPHCPRGLRNRLKCCPSQPAPVELARDSSGWEVLGEHFRSDASQHDKGSKSFLAQSGNFDGDDAVRIILDQPAAPRFIAARLIRFFVFDEPAAPDALVEPIARRL